jgi:23S rRNA pseudouridine1911/1915/1917 synthase
MDKSHRRIIADKNSTRLDKYLADSLPGLTRSRARSLIEEGNVTLDGKQVKATQAVARGQEITIQIPPEPDSRPKPEDLPVTFIHVDESVAVVNKPPGTVVHPAAGNLSGTLVNALLHHLGPLPDEGQEDRPGIVHRLDKGTSGVLVVARALDALRFLQQEFAQRNVDKTYLSITDGVPSPPVGNIDSPVGRHETKRKKMVVKAEGGRNAQTAYEVIEDFGKNALVRAMPRTGRTHQIRVHLKSLGTPVLCDPTYSGRKRLYSSELLRQKKERNERPLLARQALHAFRLAFTHPATGARVSFEAPLASDMEETLQVLRSLARSATRPEPPTASQ